MRELTKKYEEIVKGYGVDEWGAKDFDSKEFMKGLTSIRTLPICQGCLKGDGNEECRIRPCASNKKISDCSECNTLTTCKNLEELQKVRTGALRVGMLVKTDKADQQELIKKWTAEIRKKFPNRLIDI